MIDPTKERLVREQCRKAYRSDGSLFNPYAKASAEWLVWESEATKIEMEEFQSSAYGV